MNTDSSHSENLTASRPGTGAQLESGEKASPLPSREAFHIYLLMGQSNMAGRGMMTAADRRPTARVFKLDATDRWIPAADPLHFDKAARPPGVGPGSAFGPALAAATSAAIGLVPCAVGGTPLERWVKGADLYEAALARARIAMAHGILKGVIWHQGENDASALETSSTYGRRLSGMIVDLRHDLGASPTDLPFVVGQLADSLPRAKWPYTAEVNAALAALPLNVPNTACISAVGLHTMDDQVHFDSASARELGRRYANAMLELHSRKMATLTSESQRRS